MFEETWAEGVSFPFGSKAGLVYRGTLALWSREFQTAFEKYIQINSKWAEANRKVKEPFLVTFQILVSLSSCSFLPIQSI